MADLIKRIYNLWVEFLWIKEIKKAERKLERLQDATSSQTYVVNKLRKEFLRLYPLEVRDGN